MSFDNRLILESILFSKGFRRMGGKTQLYSSYKNDHYHNRLTHTIEVGTICKKIVEKLKTNYKNIVIDEQLVETAAYAHDLGHTCFGHAGERTLNKILYGEDDLGGLINTKLLSKLIFKHNLYSAKVLFGIISEENYDENLAKCIIGHTSFKYDGRVYRNDEINGALCYYLTGSNIKLFVNDFGKTIEEKIVNIGDEIAQRISDLHDSALSKAIIINEHNFGDFKIDEREYKDFCDDNCLFSIKKYLNELKNVLCDSVLLEKGEIKFTNENKKIFDYIDALVKNNSTKSSLIRCFDEKSTHIIRQIFKAYYRHPLQMEDKILKDIFKQIIIDVSKLNINRRKLIEDPLLKCFYPKAAFNLEVFKEFPNLFKSHNFNDIWIEKAYKTAYSVYVRKIAFSIANMTDRYANKIVHKLYESEI